MPNKYDFKHKAAQKNDAPSFHAHLKGIAKYRTYLKNIFLKSRIFVAGSFFSILFIALPLSAYSWYMGLPQAGLLVENAQSNRPTKILDRNGKPLYEIYVDKKYAPVALDRIPKYVILATLAVEDHEFFEHKGVRPLSILRAAKATIVDDHMQGGSTITQQVIKNILLSPERTMTRKLKEFFLAFAVERKYTKNEILELYLNNIPYGGVAWGIQSASQKFFGKDVWDLTLGESAFLASLPSSPSSYVLYANDLDLAVKRRNSVLGRMEELGIITPEENKEASGQVLSFSQTREYINAPHFVSFVRKELEDTYGKRMVEYGGLTVKTTLDLELQEKLEQIVKEEVEKDAHLNISNGAAVILDSKTGEILAYVGSLDYFKESWGAFDVITAYRQPGSTIKILTYAKALENGRTAADVIMDEPLTLDIGGGKTYSPVNYDGAFHGAVTLRTALANSYNIPAVKLVKEIGPDSMVALGKDMGLSGWEVDDSYGYSVTLGGKETRLLDLTNVYATFSRGGIYLLPTSFLSIKDANGFELFNSSERSKTRVLSEETSYIITSILSDPWARAATFGTGGSLNISGHTVAVKTGTTNDKRDNYAIGYTPTYTVGVWVGNNDNKPMNPYLASGIDGAAPIWNKTMHLLLDGSNDEKFQTPENIYVKNDSRCGRSEIFTKGTGYLDLCPKDDNTKDNNKKDD